MGNLWGFGGLVRDESGKWIVGFCGKAREGAGRFELTLFAVRECLLAINNKMKGEQLHIVIETKSEDLKHMLKDEKYELPEPDRSLAVECRGLLKKFKKYSLSSIRPGFGAAFMLATRGSLLDSMQVEILNDAPEDDYLQVILERDRSIHTSCNRFKENIQIENYF